MIKPSSYFTFLSLAYNHEKYIIEHLESIKFLIESHGRNVHCSLIINDDCSQDRTVFLIDTWLEENWNIFYSVIRLYNKKNIGTCSSVLNMLEHVNTQYLKLTACDDIYSFENIFEYSALPHDTSIRTGIPLSLTGEGLFVNYSDVLNILAGKVIYKNKSLDVRFKRLSNNNAPNIIYNRMYLFDFKIKSFLSGYDVVEDWPIQVSIAENFPNTKFDLIEKVFVYYRRTLGSTFLVAKGRFYNDKCKLFEYLIDREKNIFYLVLLKNRLALFKYGSKFANKIFNLSFYLYSFSFILGLVAVVKNFIGLDLKLDEHNKHYIIIRNKASFFLVSNNIEIN